MDATKFLGDIELEPAALRRLAETPAGAGPDSLGAATDLLLIGMGSSTFAAQTIAAHARARGIRAAVELASSDLPSLPHPSVTALAISASGQTPETVAALARHRDRAPTIAITNYPDSELGRVADTTISLRCGPEEGGVACRSFAATLAVGLRLVGDAAHDDRLGPDLLRRAADAQDDILERRAEWLPALVEAVATASTVYTVAPASRISSALQSALMLREGPRWPSVGCETGDWTHVEVYLSKHPGYTAILFGGSDFDDELMGWARKRGSTVISVGTAVEGSALAITYEGADDPLVATLAETMIVELLAAELWRLG